MTPPSRATLQETYGALDRDIWVFGYGSLMWHPDFSFVEERTARVYGYHRALCHYSPDYRGTVLDPGLVLGLDAGGSCLGRAFRVAALDVEETLRALHLREMPLSSYRPCWLRARLDDGRQETALTYVVRRDTDLYAGKLGFDDMVARIARTQGKRGTSQEYLANTVAHLDAMGIRESTLHRVLWAVDGGANTGV